MSADRYDVIIIGSGAGGGTLAHRLAPSGKRILILERGEYLPRERENWSSEAVFAGERYKAHETWHDKDGKPFHPGIHYWVGGNTKMYGAVLMRLRERDFGIVRHADGISPAWPLSYQDFESDRRIPQIRPATNRLSRSSTATGPIAAQPSRWLTMSGPSWSLG